MLESVDRALPGSFRDPSGFVFEQDGMIYREINPSYFEEFDRLIASGLYRNLLDAGLIVSHEELPRVDPKAPIRLKVERIPFISYPYEWCFSALKDAALLTLEIQKRAIEHGMSLKDASAFNVQFRGARPVFIDTLSFETLRDDRPWPAYRQFCRHFLAPLAVMAYRDVRLLGMAFGSLDGLPLDLASKILPVRSRLSFGLLLHLFVHSGMETKFSATTSKPPRRAARFGRNALLGLVASLEAAIRKLKWEPKGTEWIDYTSDTNYSAESANRKRALIGEFLDETRPGTVWDLGANTGDFSRIAASKGIHTVAMDVDPGCVEAHYREVKRVDDSRRLPLLMDLMNPSSGRGWAEAERDSLLRRGPADVAMALALVHHLAIGNNLPLEKIADWMAELCGHLVIEFVPKEDSQVARLLVVREDVFPNYHQEGFERAFARHFQTVRVEPLAEGGRTLYLMRKASPA